MHIDLQEPIAGAPNFTWRELTGTNHRQLLQHNRRVPIVYQAAGLALARMLQTIRDGLDQPVIVHSGYRSPELNAAIGGSNRSQHCKFEAADFHVMGTGLQSVFDWIRQSDIRWGQLILEGWDPMAGDTSWIHISLGHPWRAEERSNQVLCYAIRTKSYTRL